MSDVNFSWHRRAQDSIMHSALTNSKRPECFVFGVYPTHVTHGERCYLYDAGRKKYIDFICGLGSCLFGYSNGMLNEAIAHQMLKGITYSLSSTLEVECAELLKQIFPFIGKMRFLKSGTDACAAAVRMARSYHGVAAGSKQSRDLILTEGYHGWSSDFIQTTEPHYGVMNYGDCLPLKDNENRIPYAAAVIVEPVMTDNSSARVQWLANLREECTKHGTLLIFDEIITGFRFPKYSVSNYYGISPDILLLGKAIAGGLPLSVVATKHDIVVDDKEWFISSTFAGETLSLAALKKTMAMLNNSYKIEQLWMEGEDFLNRFNKLLPEQITIEGYPTRGVFRGNEKTKALFFQEACRAGILFGPSFFFNFAHIEVKDMVLNSCADILNRIKNGEVELLGDMPRSPFAQRMRG